MFLHVILGFSVNAFFFPNLAIYIRLLQKMLFSVLQSLPKQKKGCNEWNNCGFFGVCFF